MITKVAVSFGGTINLGNYENVKVDYSIEETRSEGFEYPSEAIVLLEEILSEKFAGLRVELTDKQK